MVSPKMMLLQPLQLLNMKLHFYYFQNMLKNKKNCENTRCIISISNSEGDQDRSNNVVELQNLVSLALFNALILIQIIKMYF